MSAADNTRISEILTHIRDNMIGEPPYFYLCDCLSYLQYSTVRDYLDSEKLIPITQIEGNLTKSLMLKYSTKFGANSWWDSPQASYDPELFPDRFRDMIESKKQWLTDVINDITKNEA